MPSSINASTTAGLVNTADTSGVLQLQTAGVTAISIDASQAVSFTNSPTVTGGTANGVAYLNGSKVLTTGSALVFDGTNLGIKVTPSAWQANNRAIQVSDGYASLSGNSSQGTCDLSYNCYNTTAQAVLGWKYTNSSAAATLYQQLNGAHAWHIAPSGTAGNAITFTQAMTLDASGNLGIGTTSPSTYGKFVTYSSGGYFSVDTNGQLISAQLLDSATAGGRFTGYSSRGALGAIHIEQTTTSADGGYMAFRTCASGSTTPTERARIDSSGNLLVGTTSGSARLTLRATSGSLGTFTQTSATGYGIGIVPGADTVYEAFFINNAANTLNQIRMFGNGNASFAGAVSKGSGSFRIDHPLPQLEETHQLVHSFIEGPQADLIYRGKVNLVNGTATVNIDLASSMTEGTFEALCREVQCFTTNESGWNHVRGSVTGNTLTIECQDQTASDLISWMVIGERKDKHMMDTDWTDDNGKVIIEPLKPAHRPIEENQASTITQLQADVAALKGA